MWAVLGLGNPGRRYADTRHNLGFMVVEALAARGGVRFRRASDRYELAGVELAGDRVLLAKPTTYVNRSGLAARALLDAHELVPERLLVVVDDVYLPFGLLRLRPSGSAGGHNGLRSIEALLSTQKFPRLRIGVGAPEHSRELAEHVLARFSAEERPLVAGCVDRAAQAVERVVELGVEAARALVNARAPTDT